MNEQRLLFQPERPVWVDHLWLKMPADVRRQIVSVLAEMSRNGLTRKQQAPHEEKRDES